MMYWRIHLALWMALVLFMPTAYRADAQATPADVAGGMCSLDPGFMFVFLKPQSAAGLGHVAYGFVHGSLAYYGSINGKADTPVLAAYSCGTNCSVDTEPMLAFFRRDGYERYAFRNTFEIDFVAAIQEAEARDRTTYNLVTGNCAHATAAVLDRFANALMPTMTGRLPEYSTTGANRAPNDWFDALVAQGGWTVRSF